MSHLAAALLAELDDDTLEVLAARLEPILVARLSTSHTASGWLGVKDAAAHLACPPSRLYALVSAKRIPHHKDGSRLLFDRAELDQWVRNGGGTRP